MNTKMIVAALLVGLLLSFTVLTAVAEARINYVRPCVDSDWNTVTTPYHVQVGNHVWTYYYTVVYNMGYRFADYGAWVYRGIGR